MIRQLDASTLALGNKSVVVLPLQVTEFKSLIAERKCLLKPYLSLSSKTCYKVPSQALKSELYKNVVTIRGNYMEARLF